MSYGERMRRLDAAMRRIGEIYATNRNSGTLGPISGVVKAIGDELREQLRERMGGGQEPRESVEYPAQQRPRWMDVSMRNDEEYVRRAQEKGEFLNESDLWRFYALSLAGEAGEVANLFKKHWRGDGPLDLAKVADEMADVRTYLEHLSRRLGIDLDAECDRKASVVEERLRRDVEGRSP